jgi:hypothetical protein
MTLPNFLVIGASKCGTDALCAFLAQHPELFMCPNREPNFFVAEGQPEIPYAGPGDRDAFAANDMWVSTLDRYERLFDGVRAERAIGEGTAWYVYFPFAAERIKAYLGQPRLIVILRNPVDRAYSAYNMLRGDGRESIVDFAEALAAEPERTLRNWDPLYRYVDMGFYARQLRTYFDLFPREQISIHIYDDFVEQPLATVQSIFRFLDIDPFFVPETSQRHNVSMVPRFEALHALVAGEHLLKRVFKPLLPVQVRRGLKHRVVAPNLRRPAPLDSAVRAQLQEVFRADIVELQLLVDRDLSAWLN